MAENTNSSGGGNSGLAFIIGGLLVAVLVIAFFVFRGGLPGAEKKEVSVDVNLPEVSAPATPGN
ncbi:hypothetical protein [Brevundimonas sp. M20]|jgi:hypothetical protein|uniref:hypothetical protein n=1 Tax=Brevundimonas sp. M20 TaxID=2591463 RepID=UPI001146FBA0|nr:hypothetical protein [Brevundimonas sp. M20]QDH73775.1 hypothetical protein FKQ52_10280 [Brevundimonas sp. M20]